MDLNIYGDELVGINEYGVDISSQRIDDLDQLCLEYVLKNQNVTSIDVGCGMGFHGIRMALLNSKTYLVDILDIKDYIDKINRLVRLSIPISYIKSDVRKLNMNLLPAIDVLYSQRFIHYLQYSQAIKFLVQINSKIKHGGKLYLSVSGINSELSNGYKCKEKDIRHRFCKLSLENKKKHKIKESVCLYSKEEFSNLISESGFSSIKIWESGFGNIKAIGEKR